nr:MAG TPA: hypothetical protein [Caudoviricetes sp.]
MDLHEKKQKPAEQAKATIPRRKEPVVYLGPHIKEVVNAGTVFTNGLPEHLKQAVKKMPEIGELLIPLSQVVEARKKLSIPGSSLGIFYNKAKSYKKGE